MNWLILFYARARKYFEFIDCWPPRGETRGWGDVCIVARRVLIVVNQGRYYGRLCNISRRISICRKGWGAY